MSVLRAKIRCNNCCYALLIGLLLCFQFIHVVAQNARNSSFISNKNKQSLIDLYPSKGRFIQNIGQYGDTFSEAPFMGPLKFGYEGFDMPVLFTSKGLIHLQRKVLGPSEREKEALEKMGMKREIIAQKTEVIERWMAMEFVNSNADVEIKYEQLAQGYHTYGFLSQAAKAYLQVSYLNLYKGIDVVFSFDNCTAEGFSYKVIVHPYADISQLRMQYSGNINLIKKDWRGQLNVKSDINGIEATAPVAYYENTKLALDENQLVKINYAINDSTVSFEFPNGYHTENTLVIDPFISATSNLTGANANIAKDVDFDYAGNVFVTGGGDGTVYKLAKFNASGVLQWTFSGALTVPAWSFGSYYGGWVVDKNSGNTYLGQGFAPGGGFRIIRLNSAGTYDNYITTANPNFLENWKMLWSCNNGTPQIIIAGGGTNSNINLGIVAPPSTSISSANLTGIAGWAQDISDIIIDPINNDLYSIYGSLIGTPSLTNKIYKNASPYSAASIQWNVASGFTAIQEIANRPYLVAGQIDNSSNTLAVNSSYFFYWDGRNLKAFNKSTGANVGSSLTITGNTLLMQGGIVADECNNIFIGSANGTIKVYTFNGTSFNDSTPDITITGYTTKSVFDLVLSDAKKILYACGDGFVSAIDISSYGCLSNVYALSVSSGCVNQTATASLSPTPPNNSQVTYKLYDGANLISSNQSGVFTSLTPNVNYTIHAFVNQICSGVETVKSFSITGPAIVISKSNATCGNSDGSITASATGGSGSLKFSKDGINFQNNGNFTSLSAGDYTIIVKDSIGCSSAIFVNIANSNGPTFTSSKVDAFCGTATGSITLTGSGGQSPYKYAINSGTYGSSNVFSNLNAGNYTLYIKDSTGCINHTSLSLVSFGNTTVSKVSLSASCGNNNGSVTLNVSGGTQPYRFSIDGTNFQNSNVYTGLAAGNYIFTVKDSNNCINTIVDTIRNLSSPQISSTAVPTSCTGSSGSITFSLSGGLAPYQYSINGGSAFQNSNVFSNLSVGTYNLIAKDANGCSTASTAIVTYSLPQVTDTTTLAGCTSNNGSIRAVGTGGSSPYSFSLNGTTFQSSNLFTGLGTGTYTLTIKDAAGCINSYSPVIVKNANNLQIAASTLPTSCAASTGIITLSGTGGIGALTYSVNGSSYSSANVFTGKAAGNYTSTVKDSNGCIATIVVTITSAVPPTVTGTTTPTSCSNGKGTITATGSLGKLPYTYSINGTTFQSSNVFSGLTAGTYTLTIKDSNACIGTTSVTISNNGSGTGPGIAATTTSAECGQSNGKINATGSGGGSKKFSIDGINYQSSSTFNNVPPGTYTVYIIDNNGCINYTVVTIGNITGPQVTSVDSATVCGSNTGKVTLTGSNGTPSYRFSLDGGSFQTGNVFSGLSAGYHTITVRDAANVCRNSIVVKISNSNGPSVSGSKTDATCGAHNATITIASTGGTGSKTYSIDGINYQSSNLFTGLAPGQYALYAKDSTGCFNTTTINVGEITPPVISASQTASKCGLSNASITAKGALGTAPYRFSIDGINFTNNNVFTGLAAGNYTITLKDTNNCLINTTLTIVNIGGPSVAASIFNPTCGFKNGTVLITPSGGTAPYTYSINNGSFQPSFMYNYLNAGTYFLTVKDQNNCIAVDTVLLTNQAGPSITTSEDTTGCSSGYSTLIITASGGTTPYQYSIDSITFQNSNKFTCIPTGFYHAIVRDANGCFNSSNITLTGIALPVNLLSFQANIIREYVSLDWSTTDEENIDSFAVEKMKEGGEWLLLGRVMSKPQTIGTLNYTVNDYHPFTGWSYYRLKIIERNGDYNYSNVEEVLFNRENKLNVYPNPASQTLTIELERLLKPKIKVNNALGMEIEVPFTLFGNKLILNTSALKSGVYMVELSSGTNAYSTIFTVQQLE